MNQGWIKLHREILAWRWYRDIPCKVLFVHLVLKANHEDRVWCKEVIRRGQVVTGRKRLSEETGLSEQQVRTALAKLHETGEISTIKTTNKYTLLSIEKYDEFQASESDTNQRTNQRTNQQATSKQPTDNHKQELKNEKNKRKEDRCSEPVSSSKPQAPPITALFEIPTNRKEEVFVLSQEQVNEWKPTYPAVDVVQEIRRAMAWLDANPTRRKTRRGMKPFLVRWLSKAQDRGGNRVSAEKNTDPEAGRRAEAMAKEILGHG